MAKPPVKKRELTLRELLERDAKKPLPASLGLTDDMNQTNLQNGVDSLSDDMAMNVAFDQTREGIRRRRANRLMINDPQAYVKSLDQAAPTKYPPLLSKGNLMFEALTSASPAGERPDTERARVAEYNARTNYGRNTPEEIFGMTALGNGPSYSRQSKVSKLMGVTNKNAGK
jgi:hypothetical protein